MATFDSPQTIFDFITKDFESVWNSLAAAQDGEGCNYALALHSMILLEWASRLCKSDATGAALDALSIELEKIEPRYFIRLPGKVCVTKDFTLPFRGLDPSHQLLGALFDLVRNGHAHAYHQMIVRIPDGALMLGITKFTGPTRSTESRAPAPGKTTLLFAGLGQTSGFWSALTSCSST